MGRRTLAEDVYTAAVERISNLYRDGHRVVVSFSAGKDSGVMLELAVEAATATGSLPVEVVMRDEEIMLPGTFEYAERVAARPEVDFHWLYACQPIINSFTRLQPYWWVFDPQLDPDEWVRQPPAFAYKTPHLSIQALITPETFPPAEGKDLFALIGLRADESRGRMFGLHSSGGYLTKKDPRWGYRKARPIYDWNDGDVWWYIREFEHDYNEAYDVMHRFGINRRNLRIAPPTMQAASIPMLQVARKAWPRWFDRVSRRCPGVRTAAMYGRRAVEPIRHPGETWEDCFWRTCVIDAPPWVAGRAQEIAAAAARKHASHSTAPVSQVGKCPRCPKTFSWEQIAKGAYMGDPFSLRTGMLPEIEPEFFRQGAGTWGGGSPSW